MKTKGRDYHIEFRTENLPYLEGTYITIGTFRTKNENAKFRVDLRDDPLYAKLHAYCMANPPKGGK